jgi:hypothetical protein
MRASRTRTARTARRIERKSEVKDERMMERRGRTADAFERRISERRRASREPEYKVSG